MKASIRFELRRLSILQAQTYSHKDRFLPPLFTYESSTKMAYTINKMNTTTWPQWFPFEPGQFEQMEPSVIAAITLGMLFCLYLGRILNSFLFGVKAPFVGYRSFFEPTWLLRLRFVWSGPSIINEGYRLVSKTVYDSVVEQLSILDILGLTIH